MGQRHQFFIKVVNPVSRGGDEKIKKELRKIFGNGKTAIMAFHHQWLYGRAALVNVLSIFDKSHQDKIAYNNPFDTTCNIWDVEGYLKDLNTLLSVQTHPLFPRGTGIELICFLNITDNEITKDFTLGDNNDGISVIDTINKTYCFANPYSQYDREDDSPSIRNFDTMVVKSAKEYVEVYYPSNDKNDKENNEILELFKPYKLMLQAEFKRLSPESFKLDEIKVAQ